MTVQHETEIKREVGAVPTQPSSITKIIERLERFGAKRLTALFLGSLLPGLAVDVALSHFVSGSGGYALQWVPVVFGTIGGLLVMAVALTKAPALFRRILQVTGVGSCVVGVAGIIVHLLPLFEGLEEGISASALYDALSNHAPPILAPGAFTLLGILLMALASPHLRLGITPTRSDEDLLPPNTNHR